MRGYLARGDRKMQGNTIAVEASLNTVLEEFTALCQSNSWREDLLPSPGNPTPALGISVLELQPFVSCDSLVRALPLDPPLFCYHSSTASACGNCYCSNV